MNSINIAPVRLTRDPELRALPSGSSVCELRIAYNARRKNAEGEYVDDPQFFNVIAYGSLGETIAQHLTKGSKVAVSGRLRYREWRSTEDQPRSAVDIVASEVRFLDPPANNNGSAEEPLPAGVGASSEEAIAF